MIEIKHLNKNFNIGTPDEATLFNDFDLNINNNEFVSIIGSNGSGKTTLLNMICGSLIPESGNIIINGNDITKEKEFKRAKFIGRVFQDPQKGSCSELTILENMALADNKNKSYGLSLGVNKKRISYYQTLLEKCEMGLENRMNVKAGTLSGGQRQALSLVFATMNDISLLILDEHTAALDPKSSENIMQLTNKLVAKKDITTLMVTHNLRFALEYGNRLIMMHEGKSILDLCGKDKENCEIDALLKIFNNISIEVGN
ncbi:MAG: ATP-binding cassette domain-containing protein [Oscillospiraceae bacterium]